MNLDPQGPKAERRAVVCRAELAAAEAATAALEAIDNALILGNQLGVATFGFDQLQACRGPLSQLINPHGRLVALATNELRTLEAAEPGPGGEAA